MEGKVSAHPRNVACEKKIQAGVLLKIQKLKARGEDALIAQLEERKTEAPAAS